MQIICKQIHCPLRFMLPVLVFLLTSFSAAAGRRQDMMLDKEEIRIQLEKHRGAEAWSEALYPARETFNRTSRIGKVISHGAFGNLEPALKQIHDFLQERGTDFILLRVPSAAEREFIRLHPADHPDPYLYQMRQELNRTGIEMLDPLDRKQKNLNRRIRERCPQPGPRALIFGKRVSIPGMETDFRPCSGNGSLFANDLAVAGNACLVNRPVVVLAVPGEFFHQDMAEMPSAELMEIPPEAYQLIRTWSGKSWPQLGFEPLPEPGDPYFRIRSDGLLQIAPILPEDTAGAAGVIRLPLPREKVRAVRVEILPERSADLEVTALCGKDTVRGGVLTENGIPRLDLRLRPSWVSRILELKFTVRGRALIREIRLYGVPLQGPGRADQAF